MSELRFALLGPVRAWRGDAELSLGAPQQRAVLAVLLLAEERQVSQGTLVDALWGGEPPKAARSTIRTYVSRLRRCLAVGQGGPEMIESVGDGYVLMLRSATVDLTGFAQRVREAHEAGQAGDMTRSAALLREALAVWQGVPLAGLPGPYAGAQRARLAELQLAALEDRLALDVELGRHAAAAPELRSLIAAHPTREKLSELLMHALYRAGRQAEALDVYARTQRLLNEDLGIDPGPALREMHQRILQMDEDLIGAVSAPPRTEREAWPPAPVTRPAQLPADLPAFAGRRTELARLDALLAAAGPGRLAAPIAVIDGMAGIGKTALAVHWAHRAAARFPDGQLYVNLRGFDPGGTVVSASEALRGLLGALGVAPPRIPDGLEAQAGLYRSLLSGRRMLIVLDNARDVEQVRPLLPGSPESLVLVTCRHHLTGLVTTHDAQPLALDPFSAQEAGEALARRLGADRLAADPGALAEIIELCAGLPLAMAIVAARATVYPNLPVAVIASELRDARTRLDALSAKDPATDLRAVFSWSCQLLSAPAARLFRLLSLHQGPDVSAEAAASLAGLPVAEARPLLEELAAARLTTEHLPGRFSSHDLIRVYAAELGRALDGAAGRTQALGRLLDYYAHTAHAAHLLLGPHFIVPAPAAARPGVTPGEVAGSGPALDWFSAEREVLEAAVRNATESGLHSYAWQLALTLQQFYQHQGYWHGWAATMRIALAAAVAAGDLAAQAQTRRGLAGACHFLGHDDQALAELEQARDLFRALGYTTEHAYLHSNFGAVYAGQDRHDQAIEHYWQAHELYDAIGHEKGQAASLEGIGSCHAQQGRYAEAISLAQQAMAIFRAAGDRNGEGTCWTRLGEFRHLLGQYREAADCYRRAIAICQEVGNRADEAMDWAALGDSLLDAGDPAGARQGWDTALIILDERLPLVTSIRDRLARLDPPSQPMPPAPPAAPAGRDLLPVPATCPG
ncbi:MAG: BTAD domain-containing putative transcriptional regulator [Streptosporangiaceae bacterium]